MKILYITNRVPFPANGGYPIVVRNTLKGMLKAGAQVTVFSLNPNKHFVETAYIDDPVLNNIKMITSFINADLSVYGTVKNLFLNRAHLVDRYFKADAAIQLRNLLSDNDFDLIQLEGLFVVPYLTVIRQFSTAKVVYRAHNIEYQIWERLSSSERSPIRKFYLSKIASALRKYELSHLNKFDGVVTICNSDMRELKYSGCTMPMQNFSILIDPEDYKPDTNKTEALTVFHLGSLDWLPNQEGVEWFLENVWSDLQELSVGLKFFIAGKLIPDEFMELQSNTVQIIPDLENAKEFINSKSIMVVPSLSGSGMRVKIIEAMMMKKCVISTSVGAEGLKFEHGSNILIADTADDFYRYILQCSTDRAFLNMIGENARNFVQSYYHIDSGSQKILDFYGKLLES